MKNKKNIWKHFVSIGLVIALALVCNITEYTIAFANRQQLRFLIKLRKSNKLNAARN